MMLASSDYVHSNFALSTRLVMPAPTCAACSKAPPLIEDVRWYSVSVPATNLCFCTPVADFSKLLVEVVEDAPQAGSVIVPMIPLPLTTAVRNPAQVNSAKIPFAGGVIRMPGFSSASVTRWKGWLAVVTLPEVWPGLVHGKPKMLDSVKVSSTVPVVLVS